MTQASIAKTRLGPQLPQVRSVIFDMDGVIIDSHPAHRRAWQEFLKSLGKEVSQCDLEFILDGRKRRDILLHFLGDVPEDDLTKYGKRKDEFFQRIALEVKPIAGVLDFMANLWQAGVPLAVATSASKTRTYSTLAKLSITHLFDVVVTGDEVTNGKPDPAIYIAVCERLNVEPGECVAMEDAVSGVTAAKRAGLLCIGVGDLKTRELLRRAGADHVIENFVGLSLRARAGSRKRRQGSAVVSA